MAFWEWLGQLFSQLFPPWETVAKTHTGVRQRNLPIPTGIKRWCDEQRRRGHKFLGLVHYAPEGCIYITDCGAGFAFKIPFIDEIWQMPVTLESEDLENISTETNNGLVYDISPVLTWKVRNPLKAAFDVSNYENSLKNEVRAVIVRWVNANDGRIDVARMERECTERVKRIGAEWGCFVDRVSFNSCCQAWHKYELVHRMEG